MKNEKLEKIAKNVHQLKEKADTVVEQSKQVLEKVTKTQINRQRSKNDKVKRKRQTQRAKIMMTKRESYKNTDQET